jgi:chloramphenicol-sensitive protein RarD
MQQHTKGIWLGVGAYVFWGLSPIFWNLVDGVGALELLSHRVVWAIPILVAILAVRRSLGSVPRLFRSGRTVALTVGGALAITANWGIFLWAVLNERIVEVSLGYFINPLVSVALGVIVLREHLRPAQRFAVGTATAGVVGMTLILGVVPWVSLALACAFGTYGLLKKLDGAAPALQGLLGEVAIVAAPLAVYLLAMSSGGSFTRDVPTALWLVAGGLATVVPMWMFGAGVQRIPLSTMGLLQYLAPLLQLLVGVTLYGEALAGGQVFGFVMVWIALAVFARDQFTHRRGPVIAAA